MRILHSKKIIFVSKPRCGSTSIRRILDKLFVAGDEKCDVAGEIDGLHPHMTAPAIHCYLLNKGINISDYRTFTVARDPLEMLWSYHKFFQPDVNGRYNFDKYYIDKRIDFETWLVTGKVGLGDSWKSFVPAHVSDTDLSPLSLDAHVLNENNINVCEKIFKMEDRTEIINWLKGCCDIAIDDLHVNSSKSIDAPVLSAKVVAKVRPMFKMDFELYGY